MQRIVLLGVTLSRRMDLLLRFLISGRDCEKHVDRRPIQMNPLCDEITSLPVCSVSWVGTPQ